jgi:hypothetical protein
MAWRRAAFSLLGIVCIGTSPFQDLYYYCLTRSVLYKRYETSPFTKEANQPWQTKVITIFQVKQSLPSDGLIGQPLAVTIGVPWRTEQTTKAERASVDASRSTDGQAYP